MHNMSRNDFVVDFAMKFTQILSELRTLGEVVEEQEAMRRFLREHPHLVVEVVEEEAKEGAEDELQLMKNTGRRYGHFTYECRSRKKERGDWAFVAETTAAPATASVPALTATSSLLMAVEEASLSNSLLLGSDNALEVSDYWYLDMGATNHMFGQRNFFCNLDESVSGFVKFGDNSKIPIKGKGDIVITQKNGSTLRLPKVLFVPDLAANILSLGRLDEEGCKMTTAEEVKRSEGRLYLLKLNVVDQCLITTKDDSET
ncbi:uncharacterized protein LOC144701404 [Wolffia australiana]